MIARIATATGTSPLELARLDSTWLGALNREARRSEERSDWLAEMSAQAVDRLHELLRLVHLAHFKGDPPPPYEVRRPWDTGTPQRPAARRDVLVVTAGQAARMIGAESRRGE